MSRYDAKTERAARELASRMQAAIAGVCTFTEWAPIVVETARGCGAAAWRCYDDAGGNAHAWARLDFYKVRQVRNHPTIGRQLFAAVNGEAS